MNRRKMLGSAGVGLAAAAASMVGSKAEAKTTQLNRDHFELTEWRDEANNRSEFPVVRTVPAGVREPMLGDVYLERSTGKRVRVVRREDEYRLHEREEDDGKVKQSGRLIRCIIVEEEGGAVREARYMTICFTGRVFAFADDQSWASPVHTARMGDQVRVVRMKVY